MEIFEQLSLYLSFDQKMFLRVVVITLFGWILLGTVILKLHLKHLSVTLVVQAGVMSDAILSLLSSFVMGLWLWCGDGGIKLPVWSRF